MSHFLLSTLIVFTVHLNLVQLEVKLTSPSNATSNGSRDSVLLAKVTAENHEHVQQAIETLLYPEDLHLNHQEAGHLHRVDSAEAEKLTYASSGDEYGLDMEPDIGLMNETFNKMFSKPRSDGYSKRLKESARQSIVSKFKEYKLEAFTQQFTANKRGSQYRGVNLIGILPGKQRDVPGKDRIVLLGAHYDTVESSPGIDDNGSGMVATLEVARLLSAKPQLDHTVMFVAFDLEEHGLLGSMAFVREYLIPKELMAKNSKFLGAYIIDMVLNYDPTPGSQILPRDISVGTPEISRKLALEGNKGDFVAIWMRKGVDDKVFGSLSNEWSKSRSGGVYKIQAFDPPLPSSNPSSTELLRLGTFTRSDHASFWYHKHPSYRKTLNAVLLTDMGPWRGIHKRCYHSWCDDSNQLTNKNLNYLKHTITMLTNVIEKSPPTTDRTDGSRSLVPTRRGFRGGPSIGQPGMPPVPRLHWF